MERNRRQEAPESVPPLTGMPPVARAVSTLPTYQIVLTSGPPMGYREFAVLPGTVLACERCASVVVDPVMHDQWHLRH